MLLRCLPDCIASDSVASEGVTSEGVGSTCVNEDDTTIQICLPKLLEDRSKIVEDSYVGMPAIQLSWM